MEDDLGQLERDIRQLKIEYEQFFGGGRKRPPSEIEWRIDLIIKRYSERMGDLSYAHRFRFNTLLQTNAKYKEMFRKRLQQKEEGTVQHHFGAAARAIEAERARQHAAEAPKPSASAAVASAPAAPFRMACSEPDRERDKVEQLYQAFFNAKQAAGEDTGRFDRDSFRDFVRKKTKDLRKQKGCKEVEYVVEITDGKAKLKALVKS